MDPGTTSSLLARTILAAWDAKGAAKDTPFRSHSAAFSRRSIPGRHGFVVQGNAAYLKAKRPAASTLEPAADVPVRRPFDHSLAFNFNRVRDNEKMVDVAMTRDGLCVPLRERKDGKDGDTHHVIVNISPMARGHFLVPPFVERCLPQVMTETALFLGLSLTAAMGDGGGPGGFSLCFNSLGAWASQNHLHWHGLWVGHIFPEQHVFPVDAARGECLLSSGGGKKDDGVSVERVGGARDGDGDGAYPISALRFSAAKATKALRALCKRAFAVVEAMLTKNIAHHILLSCSADGGDVRCLLMPRQSQVANITLKMAVVECCGLIVARTEEQMEDPSVLTEDVVERAMRKEVRVEEAVFRALEEVAVTQSGGRDNAL